MSNAPPGWPVLAGEVLNTLGAVQTQSRATGHALTPLNPEVIPA